MTDKKNKGGGSRPQIDTKALLARVDIVEVIGARVPLAKSGAEYEACCPFHTEKTPSFKVSPAKQFYNCFGCGANGDAIKFLMEHDGLTFVEACRALGADVPDSNAPPAERQPKRAGAAAKASVAADSAGGAEGASHPREGKDDKIAWQFVMPIPDEAPEAPLANRFRGKYSRRWEYRDGEGRLLGYVCRFETSDGGKEIIPLTWCRHPDTGFCSWQWLSFPEPRPLYGLDRLAAKPDATVLLVEGEKCADAAQAELPELVVVSWPGGGKAVGKADWSPLAGRKVMAWADCDAKHERLTPEEKKAGADPLSKPLLPPEKQPGVMAMNKIADQVLALEGARWWDVKIPAPGEKPDGWDIADAIEEGLKGAALADFLRAKENRIERQPAQPGEGPSPPIEASAGESWTARLVRKRGELAICTANIADILLNRPEWEGVLGYDDFEKRTVKLRPPPFFGGETGDWDDSDDTWTSMWLARMFGFTPSSQLVSEAVEAIAKKVFKFNPVQDYLNALKWDEKARLDSWLTKYLGVEASEYSKLAGRFFMIAMIARAMAPGGQFKYCLILEGQQDAGKSKALRILGDPWYGDTDMDLHNKDSMVAIQGKWLYEFPEMDTISRAEASRTKSFLSRQIDEFRPHYGRRIIKCKRQTVFAGSVNEFQYLKDPSGAVRFWPVLCEGEIKHDALSADRDQLFAEAYVRWKAGERYFPTKEQQRDLFSPQQIKRQQEDDLVDVLHDWVYARTANFTAADAMMECLKLDASKMTRDTQTRVGIALRKLGCTRVERRNGMIRYWYKPPEIKEAESKTEPPAQQEWGGDHVPF